MERKNYTLAEQTTIQEMYKAGKTAVEIANILDRTPAAIRSFIQREKDKDKEPEVKEVIKEVVKKEKLTPREMIKQLYDLGYRIKNNGLVVVSVQEVNLADIVRS